MGTYFTAYRNRMEANSKNLLALKSELEQMGYIVKVWKDKELHRSITVYDQEMQNGVRVQFNEVPYRWSFEYDIDPKNGKGSGYTGNEYSVNSIEAQPFFPFTIKDITGNMNPMYIDKRFENLKTTKTP